MLLPVTCTGTMAPVQAVSRIVISKRSWMVSVTGGCARAAAGRSPDNAKTRSTRNRALLFIGPPHLSRDAPHWSALLVRLCAPRPLPTRGLGVVFVSRSSSPVRLGQLGTGSPGGYRRNDERRFVRH